MPNVKYAGGREGAKCSWIRRLNVGEFDCRTERGSSFQRRVVLGMKELENRVVLLKVGVSVFEFRKFLPVCVNRASGRTELI